MRSLRAGDLWTSKRRFLVTARCRLSGAKPRGRRLLKVEAKIFGHSSVPVVEEGRPVAGELWTSKKCVARICFVYSLVAAMILIVKGKFSISVRCRLLSRQESVPSRLQRCGYNVHRYYLLTDRNYICNYSLFRNYKFMWLHPAERRSVSPSTLPKLSFIHRP